MHYLLEMLNLPDLSTEDNVEYVFSLGQSLHETPGRIVHYVVDPKPTWASVGTKEQRIIGICKKNEGKSLEVLFFQFNFVN